MKPYDVAIWERFLAEYPTYYNKVQYDVPCGEGPQFDTLANEETGGHDERLYKRKIDVVGFRGNEVDIIEVKPRAGPSAIGQVKMYRQLYFVDYKPLRNPNCVIITDSFSNDVAEFAVREQVRLFAV